MELIPKKKANEGSSRVEADARDAPLPPIQIWAPDACQHNFDAEAARQSARVSDSPFAAEDQAAVDAISDGGL